MVCIIIGLLPGNCLFCIVLCSKSQDFEPNSRPTSCAKLLQNRIPKPPLRPTHRTVSTRQRAAAAPKGTPHTPTELRQAGVTEQVVVVQELGSKNLQRHCSKGDYLFFPLRRYRVNGTNRSTIMITDLGRPCCPSQKVNTVLEVLP